MHSFEGYHCPVCMGRFFEDDDIVVCPICGTPHHRDCYASLGHCANEEKHASGYVWEPPQKQTPPAGDSARGHICRNCGKQSSGDILFCPYCGHPFIEQGAGGPGPGAPFAGQFGGYAQVDPLGGVNPTSQIEGVPVTDVASFVSVNTPRYIPRFKSMAERKSKTGWNWAAFLSMLFSMPFWFFYRKDYKMGIVATCCNLLCGVLAAPMTAAIYSISPSGANYMTMVQIIAENLQQLGVLPIILAGAGSALSIAAAVLFGLFSDYFYKAHTIKTLQAIQKDAGVEDKKAAIAQKGGVNLVLPLAISLAVNFLSGMVPALFMLS